MGGDGFIPVPPMDIIVGLPFYVVQPGKDGVVGDGVTNDTVALQAILTANPFVFFSPGSPAYAIAGLIPQSNAYVFCPPACKFVLPSGSNSEMLDFNNPAGTVWWGGEFDGTNQGASGVRLIKVDGASNQKSSLLFAYIHDGYSTGIDIVNSGGQTQDFDIGYCNIVNNGQRSGVGGSDMHGIKTQGYRVNIYRCNIIGNGYKRSYGDGQPSNTSGIKILGSGAHTEVSYCVIAQNGGKGVEIAALHAMIHDNVVLANEEIGIFGNGSNGADHLTANDNIVMNNLNNGFDFNTVPHYLICDNVSCFNGTSRNATGQNQEGSGVFINSCNGGGIVKGNDCCDNSQGQTDNAPAFGGDGRSGIRISDTGAPTIGLLIDSNSCLGTRVQNGFTAVLDGAITASAQTMKLKSVVGTIPRDGNFTVMIDLGGGSPEIVVCKWTTSGLTFPIIRAENNTNGSSHADGTAVNLENTQKYGIHQKATSGGIGNDDYEIVHNWVQGNRTAGIKEANSTPAPSRMVNDNIGYATEAQGTATVVSGTTTITVNHGLSQDRTPVKSDVSLTLQNGGTNNFQLFWVNAINATQLTINVRADPGAAGAIIGWKIRVRGEGTNP